MGAYPGPAVTCCGAKCGIPQIVSIGDDNRMPDMAGQTAGQGGYGHATASNVPDWLGTLAPSLAGEEAVQAAEAWVRCREELRRRSRAFLVRAASGAPCRLVDQRRGVCHMARYTISADLDILHVEEEASTGVGDELITEEDCCLADVRNIWVCTDSELARRARGVVHKFLADADPESDQEYCKTVFPEYAECVLLIDAPSGPLCIVEKTPEAQEEFLDTMAVLISMQRARTQVDGQVLAPGGPPPPEVQLRPLGRSLQSAHLTGPIGVWLAEVGDGLATLPLASEGEGDDELPPKEQMKPA
mmetsp:Transcript_69963/g.130796  ORF Transcript_69963/g.130796 Transcript_69963/m.130796 type:complete len:302 (+) Transcript_69963:121-1026(+)